MSRSDHLLLPRPLYEAMLQQAQTELPNECCGLLAGVRETTALRFFYLFPLGKRAFVESRVRHRDVLRALAIHPLINEAASPVEYRSEPRSMFEAVREMRKHDYEILAIYHSHPTSEPIPSQTDLDRHYSSDVVHFIIGLKKAQPLLRGWWLTETTYEEAGWKILDS